MKQLFLPEDYTSVLDVWQTEHAIKFIKDTFQLALAAELKLRRITAPIVVPSGKGLNDNLSGTEQPVSFGARVLGGQRAEIVQSLAKWKRYALWRHHIQPGMGIYTDMNALRPDSFGVCRSVGLGEGDYPGRTHAGAVTALCRENLCGLETYRIFIE